MKFTPLICLVGVLTLSYVSCQQANQQNQQANPSAQTLSLRPPQSTCRPRCQPNQTCRNGVCVSLCGPFRPCPYGQTCFQGQCIDRCASIRCAPSYKCQNGQCVLIDKCMTVKCNATTTCINGICVDNCARKICPRGQTCSNG
jgi:hypothetical protein